MSRVQIRLRTHFWRLKFFWSTSSPSNPKSVRFNLPNRFYLTSSGWLIFFSRLVSVCFVTHRHGTGSGWGFELSLRDLMESLPAAQEPSPLKPDPTLVLGFGFFLAEKNPPGTAQATANKNAPMNLPSTISV